jgi:DNA-binding NtrC family response regulator
LSATASTRAPDAAAAAPPQPVKVDGGKPQEVILVVEDDALMRRIATESLNKLGYTAIDTESAAHALTALDTRDDIALLFTDIMMPDVNGKALADRRRPGLKVIYTTGYTPTPWCMAACSTPACSF